MINQASLTMPKTLAEQFWQAIALPDNALLGVKIPKKTLTDNAALTSTDKALVKEVLKSIEWRYSLKSENVNIPSFEDGIHEYLEIAALKVVVKSNAKTKQLCRLLHQHIPYPLLLVIEAESHEGEREWQLALSLADKRINQADSNKLTIEHQYDTGWLNPSTASSKRSSATNEFQQAFFNDMAFSSLSKVSLYDFYLDLIAKFNRFEAAKFTGTYKTELNDIDASSSDTNKDHDLTLRLHELKALESALSVVRSKIKKATQMNQKVKLNVEAKLLKQQIATIKASI